MESSVGTLHCCHTAEHTPFSSALWPTVCVRTHCCSISMQSLKLIGAHIVSVCFSGCKRKLPVRASGSLLRAVVVVLSTVWQQEEARREPFGVNTCKTSCPLVVYHVKFVPANICLGRANFATIFRDIRTCWSSALVEARII